MSQRYIGGLIYNPPGGFSGYFDGSGDWLQAGTNANLALGSGDFTIEGWFFCTGYNGGAALYSTINTYASSTGLLFYIDVNGRYTIDVNGTILQPSGAAALNTWIHYAVVRSSSTLTIYINGNSIGSVSSTTNFTDQYAVIGRTGAGTASNYFLGYISNTRMVKGTALYTSAFTPPNGPLQAITNTSLLTCAYSTFRDGSTNNFTITVNGNTAVSTQNPFPLTTLPNPALGNQGNGVYSMSQYQSLLSQNLWPAVDPYWRYVTLMLHGNGTNGAQNNTFLDSSTNNFTITRNGNTTQGTFSPYGSNWSNFFDGSGDSLSRSVSSTSDGMYVDGSTYTVEAFIFPTAQSGYIYTVSQSNVGGFGYWVFDIVNSSLGVYVRATQSGAELGVRAGNVPLNTWSHVAASVSAGQARLFINGVQVGATTSVNSATFTPASAGIGAITNGYTPEGFFSGYISNLRIVKGTALYTANFTPPASPLTAVSGTSFLTCQSNRFIDNSTNAYTLTRNGDTSVQRFSPFNPTAPYAAGTDGGSGYFDGTGDYIQAADSASLSFSGDFTCEGWFYYTGTAASLVPSILIDSGTSAVSAFEINNGSTYLQLAGQVTNNTISRTTFSGTVAPGAWTHIAYVRSSNVIRVYVNGVVSATTLSNSVATGRIRQVGEGRTSGLPFPGYISNFRLVGSAVYTSNFTPPTSPVTAITNTQLLCDFTNAGILDNAEMNNLETVGNAQISTAQSKFGGASMLFDGTGDYLTFPANNTLQFGTGDFTIEFWTYLNSVTGFQMFIDNRNSTLSSAAYITIYSSGTSLIFYTTGNDRITATSALSTGAWLHIAVSKSSGSTKMFVNGSQVGSTYSDANSYLAASTPQYIASRVSAADFNLNGYIDDLRITKGYARYTGNFTPQRSQWQDQ